MTNLNLSLQKTLHYGAPVRPFDIPQPQMPKIVTETADPNITKCTQLECT